MRQLVSMVNGNTGFAKHCDDVMMRKHTAAALAVLHQPRVATGSRPVPRKGLQADSGDAGEVQGWCRGGTGVVQE